MRYELYYWPGIPGRGEFVRLALEEAGADYVDVARKDGVPALMRILNDAKAEHPPFAPPILKAGKLLIGQTANILMYLGGKHGLAPANEVGRLWTHQLQLTMSDFLVEAHDTHHPIAGGLYYEDQKGAALRAAAAFREERIPAFLDYFERAASGDAWFAGDGWTYADTSLFQLWDGLHYAFPKRMKALADGYPKLAAIAKRTAALPRLKEYLASERRLAFNEDDLFRRYPELDAA